MSTSPLPSSRPATTIAAPPVVHTPTPPGSLSLPSFAQAFGTAGASQGNNRERGYREYGEYDYNEQHDGPRPATSGGGGSGGRLPPIHIQSSQNQIQRSTRFDTRFPRYDTPQQLPPLKRDSRKRTHADRDDSSEAPSSPLAVKVEEVDQLDPSLSPQPPPLPPPSSGVNNSPGKPTRGKHPHLQHQQLHLNTNLPSLNHANNSNVNNTNANHANTTNPATNSNSTHANLNSNTNNSQPIHSHPANAAALASIAGTTPLLAPSSGSTPRSHKRRRVTISGAGHPNPNNFTSGGGILDGTGIVRSPPTQPGSHTHTGPSTPISPVVVGFPIQRDPQAVEQMRAMLAVKQKQKAIIESRRGSAAGILDLGKRGSNAGLGSGAGMGLGLSGVGESNATTTTRRASVATSAPSVHIVNPTPTTATAPAIGNPIRRSGSGSSPNGYRLAPTPPSMSPKTRTGGLASSSSTSSGPAGNSSRTRSPSLLGSGVVTAAQQQQQQLQHARSPPSSSHAISNQNPSQNGQNQSQVQGTGGVQQQNQGQGQGQGRPLQPPPLSTAPTASGTNNTNSAISAANITTSTSTSTSRPSRSPPQQPSSSAHTHPLSNNSSSGRPSQVHSPPQSGANSAIPLSSSSISTTTTINSTTPNQTPASSAGVVISSGQVQQQQGQGQSGQIQQLNSQFTALKENFPPLPNSNSFSKRRASQLGMRGNKKPKPADLMISPRETDLGSGSGLGLGLSSGLGSAASATPGSGGGVGSNRNKHGSGNNNHNNVAMSIGNATTGLVPPPMGSAKQTMAQQLQQQQQVQPGQKDINATMPHMNQQDQLKHQHYQQQQQQQRSLSSFVVPLSANYKTLQPAIQSAPPRPGQIPGRFPNFTHPSSLSAAKTPMALPTLPPVLSSGQGQRGTSVRRMGQVPPTPTSLSMSTMQQRAGTASQVGDNATVRLSSHRIPKTATAATFFSSPLAQGSSSSTSNSHAGLGLGVKTPLPPLTPATFHHRAIRNSGNASSTSAANSAPTASSSSGPGLGPSNRTVSTTEREREKLAFMAPFEQFYDVLSDAQVLKGWFGEQLKRVGKVAREVEEEVGKLRQERERFREERERAAAEGIAGSSNGAGNFTRDDVERLVTDAVRRESRTWQDEVGRLRAQVADLQDALFATGGSTQSRGIGNITRSGVNGGERDREARNQHQDRVLPHNGSGASSALGTGVSSSIESYTFPPVQRPSSSSNTIPPITSSVSRHSEDSLTIGGTLRRSSSSPPPQPVDTRSGPSTRAVAMGMAAIPSSERSSVSASSPEPVGSVYGGGSGIGRRLSVSAIRFEREKFPPLPLHATKSQSRLQPQRQPQRQEEEEEEELVEEGRRKKQKQMAETGSEKVAGVEKDVNEDEVVGKGGGEKNGRKRMGEGVDKDKKTLPHRHRRPSSPASVPMDESP